MSTFCYLRTEARLSPSTITFHPVHELWSNFRVMDLDVADDVTILSKITGGGF